MQVIRTSSSDPLDSAYGPTGAAIERNILRGHNALSILQDDATFRAPYHLEGPSMDNLLLKRTRVICDRYNIEFSLLSSIQRKFVTHYRCNNCGLLPLYHLDLLHVKRVRCRKCGQLIAFKRKGKYGKLRKEIAFELVKEIQRCRAR